MYINIKGKLVDLSCPYIMGIINITPDSFYQGSRKQTTSEIVERINQIREEGADIIDIGGYSSRPHATPIDEGEEWKRLEFGLKIISSEYPDAVVSVDTFRSGIARRCVEEYGIAMINDISGGEIDNRMFDTVAALRVPYIMMHMKGNPQTMMQYTQYDHLFKDIFLYFSAKVDLLHQKGVNDIIIDPGFGFSKNTDQNYQLMDKLEEFRIFELPLLVGISRKTMIREVLGCSAEESLNGTTVLNTIALLKGANILRVHDVREAVQCVQLFNKLKDTTDAL